jgi:hypothetical protein
MHAISFEEFLAGSALGMEQLKLLRRRDQTACAFGRREVYKSIGFVELDCVATLLANALASSFDRTFAAQLVRVHCDQWLPCVARAEAGKPAFFTIVESFNKTGKRQHVACGTETDDPYKIAADVGHATGVPVRRTVAVNVAGILADVRANAKRAGLNWSEAFAPPEGDPRLDEIMRPYVEERDKAIDIAVKARRAGIKARALVEASIPERLN